MEYELLKKGEWFEQIFDKILPRYKKEILRYPKDDYTYLQLQWTGQGFALGLTKNIKEDYWQYINREGFDDSDCSLVYTYRELENIPDEDDEGYELEIEREQWPEDESDIYYLEYFMLYTMLALVYQELEKDRELKDYFSKIEKKVIVATDRHLKPFNHISASLEERQQMVDLLVKKEEHKNLILDLWEDQLKGKGAELIAYFK